MYNKKSSFNVIQLNVSIMGRVNMKPTAQNI